MKKNARDITKTKIGIERTDTDIWIGPLRKSGKVDEIVAYYDIRGLSTSALRTREEWALNIVKCWNNTDARVKELLPGFYLVEGEGTFSKVKDSLVSGLKRAMSDPTGRGLAEYEHAQKEFAS